MVHNPKNVNLTALNNCNVYVKTFHLSALVINLKKLIDIQQMHKTNRQRTVFSIQKVLSMRTFHLRRM